MVILEAGAIPSFAKEGWTRPKENAAKHPLKERTEGLFQATAYSFPNGFNNRWLETTTPSAPLRNGAIFFMAQPPLLREGGVYARPNGFPNLDSSAWTGGEAASDCF